MSDTDTKPVNASEDELARPNEKEALASLREYALGPIKAVFTWSEAGVILDLIEMLTKSGVIEVAIRNPSVAEYMTHWEGRAETAEVERDSLAAKLKSAEEALRPAGNIAYNMKQTAIYTSDRDNYRRISEAIDAALASLQQPGGRT